VKVSDLNIEMVNEMSLDNVKEKAKAVKDGVKDATNKVVTTIKDEYVDNKKAFSIFKNKLKSKFGNGDEPTAEEFKKAIEQLKDNGRLVVIGTIGASPGSTITLPIAMKVAKKLGIRLAPEKTF